MRFQNLLGAAILTTSALFIGCAKNEAPINTSGAKSSNANAVAVEADNPLATTKVPEAAAANSAPTLAPVVQNFYEGLKKKDEAAVKKSLSQRALKYWEAEGKAERKTALAYLVEAEDPIDEKREVRNEKIEGETAVAEMKGGSLGVWTPTKFVRENGEWKFASPEDSISMQNSPKTAANANSTK